MVFDAKPPPLDDREQALLELLAQSWREGKPWPLKGPLRIDLHPTGNLDKILGGLPKYPRLVEEERVADQGEGRLRLTILGLERTALGQQDVEPFLALARRAIERYVEDPFGNTGVTENDLREILGTSRAGEVARLGDFYYAAWDGTSEPNGAGWRLRAEISQIHLRDAKSAWEFLNKDVWGKPLPIGELDEGHQRLLRTIRDRWASTNEWPQLVRIVLDHLDLGNPLKLLSEIPRRLLYPSHARGTPQERSELTLRGVTVAHPPDGETFVKILNAIAKLHIATKGMEWLSAGRIAETAEVPLDVTQRFGRLIMHEEPAHVEVHIEGDNWSAKGRPQILRWSGLSSFEEYARQCSDEIDDGSRGAIDSRPWASDAVVEMYGEEQLGTAGFADEDSDPPTVASPYPLPALPAPFREWIPEKLLGEGGQAKTYLVRHSANSDRKAVVKQLKPWSQEDKSPSMEEKRGRFKREATVLLILAEEGCPNIVRVLESELSSTTEEPWYVMPHYEAGPMCRDGVDNKPTYLEKYAGDIDRVLEIVRTVAVTLDWMHQHPNRYVHRDVHTGNLFFETVGGTPILGDFGLVHDGSIQSANRTGVREPFGPWRWRPPELHPGSNDQGNPRSDIYLLGGVLYESLTGGKYIEETQRGDGSFVHDLAEFSISNFTSDPRVEEVNELLRRMLVRDPTRRAAAREIIAACAKIRRRVSPE